MAHSKKRIKISQKSLTAMQCRDFIHKKLIISSKHCPTCGEIVNRKIESKVCDDITHARRKKESIRFCMDCGDRLAVNTDT